MTSTWPAARRDWSHRVHLVLTADQGSRTPKPSLPPAALLLCSGCRRPGSRQTGALQIGQDVLAPRWRVFVCLLIRTLGDALALRKAKTELARMVKSRRCRLGQPHWGDPT